MGESALAAAPPVAELPPAPEPPKPEDPATPPEPKFDDRGSDGTRSKPLNPTFASGSEQLALAPAKASKHNPKSRRDLDSRIG